MGGSSSSAGRPRRLGRGLSALIEQPAAVPIDRGPGEGAGGIEPGRNPENPPSLGGLSASGLTQVGVGEVRANRYQPREAMDEEGLAALSASIRRSGVMQPIVVRPAEGGGYELIAGERRWRAAKRAGLERVPALVRELGEREAAEWALVENTQRADLNPVERARAYRRLRDEFGMTQEEIADAAGVQRPTVANLMRLLELDDEILGMVRDGRLSAGHAKVLLSESHVERRAGLGVRCARGGWSVRRLEREIAQGERAPVDAGDVREEVGRRELALRDLERRMGEHLGTRVRLRTDRSGTKGRITIEFFDLDHFDGLLSKLGVSIEG